jgi:hypothetical protein
MSWSSARPRQPSSWRSSAHPSRASRTPMVRLAHCVPAPSRSTGQRVVALGIGGVLAVLGAAETRRLASADAHHARQRARQLGLIRTTVAGIFLVRPTLLPRLLGMEVDAGPARWLPRLFAVRELVIGVGAIADSRQERDPWPALLAISAVDAAEALVILEALRQRASPLDRALGFTLADLGSAFALPVLIKRVRAGAAAPAIQADI